MEAAIKETDRRRKMQEEYNKEHGITPKTIIKEVTQNLEISKSTKEDDIAVAKMSPEEIEAEIVRLEERMKKAAMDLEFELAAALRDEIIVLSGKTKGKK